jgi:hypothetical protein
MHDKCIFIHVANWNESYVQAGRVLVCIQVLHVNMVCNMLWKIKALTFTPLHSCRQTHKHIGVRNLPCVGIRRVGEGGGEARAVCHK